MAKPLDMLERMNAIRQNGRSNSIWMVSKKVLRFLNISAILVLRIYFISREEPNLNSFAEQLLFTAKIGDGCLVKPSKKMLMLVIN